MAGRRVLRELCVADLKLQWRVGSQEDAEDLASSSFDELADVSDPASVRDLERAYLESLASGEEPIAAPAESIAEIAQILLVDQALNGLSPNAECAFTYSQVNGLTYAEIAKKLGVSLSMVGKYIAQDLSRCYSLGQGMRLGAYHAESEIVIRISK